MSDRKETTKHHQRNIKFNEKVRKAKEHRKIRKERKESGAPTGIPQTLETLRTVDETLIVKDDPDLLLEEGVDEVADIYRNERSPKILLTFSDRVCPRTIGFCKELSQIIPNLKVVARWHLPIKKMIPKAIAHGYSALAVINEDNKKANMLVISYLPNGPTLTFRLSNVLLRREIRGRYHRRTQQIEPAVIPHLLTTRFTTRLGRRTERLLGALFPEQSRNPPETHSRTVVFHNQRDFIFFRHFRYQQRMVKSSESGPAKPYMATNEVGPRFTLKLRSIQLGTFDSQFGDYEWVFKRNEVGRSRRTFVL